MVHWLELTLNGDVSLKWAQLKWYVENHDCKTEIYIKPTGNLCYVIRLQCDQTYNELDLEVDSWETYSLYTYRKKPQGLVQSPNGIKFYLKKYVTRELEESKKFLEMLELIEGEAQDRRDASL